MAVDLEKIRRAWAARRRNRIGLRRKAVDHEPDTSQPTDPNGGFLPTNPEAARKVDLITMPEGVDGTSCGNCSFFADDYCQNPEVDQPVNARMCCNAWHHDGMFRGWEEEEGDSEKAGFANDAATPERLRLAECIADILGGILGGEALTALSQMDSAPLDHPRDRAGRYVDKGSPQAVAMARHAVLKVWMGTRDLRELMECLLNISVAQVRAIRDEWKLKPGKELEKRLTKVVAKLLPGKKE